MKKIKTRFYIIFILTTLFLLLFPGIYLYYDIYLSNYFPRPYERFVIFPTGKAPSLTTVFVNGVLNYVTLSACILIAFLFSKLCSLFFDKTFFKFSWLNSLFIAVILTLLLTLFYYIYLFLSYKIENGFITSFIFEITSPQIKLLALLYFFIIFPITLVCIKKRINVLS